MPNIWQLWPSNPETPGAFAGGGFDSTPDNPWGRWNEWAIDGGIWGIREVADPPLAIADLNVLGGWYFLAVKDHYSTGDVAAAIAQLNADFNTATTGITFTAAVDESNPERVLLAVDLGDETEGKLCKGFAAAYGITKEAMDSAVLSDSAPIRWTPGIGDFFGILYEMASPEDATSWAVLLNEAIALWNETPPLAPPAHLPPSPPSASTRKRAPATST